ncbi:CLUMA_CG008161, isoform A [Clunio marinus]|uniref:CLUMA_CG008161, isoform A n=1 Tax=Clunio marinus TaxID=568069 RepID=A0A1J1I2Z9_9DIPT|nr:CLUMA_CG008161, isoform A [Clunio marinus]
MFIVDSRVKLLFTTFFPSAIKRVTSDSSLPCLDSVQVESPPTDIHVRLKTHAVTIFAITPNV